MTTVNSDGMKLLINQFNFYPGERSLERMLPHRQESIVEIRPERTDCSSRVRGLSISDRGCVFDNEHHLRYFVNCIETTMLILKLENHFSFKIFPDLLRRKLSSRVQNASAHQDMRMPAVLLLQHREH